MVVLSQVVEACSSDAKVISDTIIGVTLIVGGAFCVWAFFKYAF